MNTKKIQQPYLSGLINDFGAILERYWLSSSGVAVVVDQAVPLFIRKDKQSICLLASVQRPYDIHKRDLKLKYDLCRIEKTEANARSYLNQLHLFVINNYFSRPSGIPDERMLKLPIWSTWSYYKQSIDEKVVIDYAQQIVDNGYPNSQIEIDDK